MSEHFPRPPDLTSPPIFRGPVSSDLLHTDQPKAMPRVTASLSTSGSGRSLSRGQMECPTDEEDSDYDQEFEIEHVNSRTDLFASVCPALLERAWELSAERRDDEIKTTRSLFMDLFILPIYAEWRQNRWTPLSLSFSDSLMTGDLSRLHWSRCQLLLKPLPDTTTPRRTFSSTIGLTPRVHSRSVSDAARNKLWTTLATIQMTS